MKGFISCCILWFLWPILLWALPSTQFHEMLYFAVVNHQETQQIVRVLVDQNGKRYFRRDDFKHWRIVLPKANLITFEGDSYYPLSALSKQKVRIDESAGKIFLNLNASHFKQSKFNFNKRKKYSLKRPTDTGLFFNYDLFSERSASQLTDIGGNQKFETDANGNFELGLFNRYGSGSASVLVKNMVGLGDNNLNRPNHVVRLNTSWRYDDPDTMRTWTFGDAVADPGLWGDAVGFAGVQWRSNFSLQSDFYQLPFPVVKGVAVMPSTMDVYVNNMLAGKQNLQTGPFDVNNLPVVTGSGDINLVITDALGRKRVIMVPYYADQNILRQGLHRFSVSLGALRHDFGLISFGYGDPVLSATSHYGLTNHLTQHWHTEMTPKIQDAGTGMSVLLGHYGVLTGAAAASHIHGGFGGLGSIQLTHQGNRVSYSLNAEATTSKFELTGSDASASLSPIVQAQANLSFSDILGGGVGFGYLYQRNRKNLITPLLSQHVSQLSVSYSTSVFHRGYISLSASKSLNGQKNNAIQLLFGLTLTHDTSLNLNASRIQNQNQWSASIDKSLPMGDGFGYQLGITRGDQKSIQGEVKYQNRFGSYRGDIQHLNDIGNTYQAEVRGGLVMMRRQWFATHYLDGDSFGLVRVSNLPKVQVFLENQKIAKTNKKGYAFIPSLTPYVQNHVSIDTKHIPLDANIKQTKMILMPFYRSGIYGEFDVHRVHSVEMRAKLKNGKMVPENASLELNGKKLFNTSVGSDGLVYLSNLSFKKRNKLNIYWFNKQRVLNQCDLHFSYRNKTGSRLGENNLGDIMCQMKQANLDALKATGRFAKKPEKENKRQYALNKKKKDFASRMYALKFPFVGDNRFAFHDKLELPQFG